MRKNAGGGGPADMSPSFSVGPWSTAAKGSGHLGSLHPSEEKVTPIDSPISSALKAVIQQCEERMEFATACPTFTAACLQSEHPVQQAINSINSECAGPHIIDVEEGGTSDAIMDITIRGVENTVLRVAGNAVFGKVRVESSAGLILKNLQLKELVLDSAIGVSLTGTDSSDSIDVTLTGTGFNEAVIDGGKGNDHIRVSVHNPLARLHLQDSGVDSSDTDEILDYTYSPITVHVREIHIGEHGVISRDTSLERHSLFTFSTANVFSPMVGAQMKIVGTRHVLLHGDITAHEAGSFDVSAAHGVHLMENSQIYMEGTMLHLIRY